MEKITYTVLHTVQEHDLAINIKSGDLRVLATPVMVAWMEEAAMLAARPTLPEGCTTVGGFIGVSHLKPTAINKEVSITATLESTEGKKLKFSVTASDEQGLIGQGEHLRFVVDSEKFMSRLG